MYEKLIKRTVWVAECKCGEFKDVKTENPPREKMCPNCNEWVEYKEETYIGKDFETTETK